MPRGDGTGPMGIGPMTGRGMGCCAGYQVPGFANAGGMGRGRGFRGMRFATGLPAWARSGAYPQGYAPAAYQDAAPYANEGAAPDVDEKEALQKQADFLEKQLKEVQEQLNRFEKSE